MPIVQAAAQLAPVPYVGGAVGVLGQIVDACQQISVHRDKAKRLADKCTQLLVALEEHRSDELDTELQTRMDEATAVYETILGRVRRWLRYGKLQTFARYYDIKDGIEKCEQDLDDNFNRLQFHAVLILNKNQAEARERHLRQSEELLQNQMIQLKEAEESRMAQIEALRRRENEELRQLIYSGFSQGRRELGPILELQESGDNVAELIMSGGERQLEALNEENDSLGENMQEETSSPCDNLQTQPSRNQQRDVIQRGLLELHRLTGIPTTVKILNGTVTKEGERAFAGGQYSVVWRGRWLDQTKVAIKVLRNIEASDPKARKRFEREVKVWAKLENNHILPFLGIVTDQGQHIQMVSPWQDNGNVLNYIESQPDTNRIHLLSGAAKGLEYIHSKNITHGNVKCSNILVTSAGEACICDFGMSKIIEDVTGTSASATLTTSGSARWLAPELITGTVSSPTKEADVYSFGMAMLELLTRKPPYADLRRDATVIYGVVVLKKIPERPVEPEVVRWLSDPLWTLMRECWKVPESSRPSMVQTSATIQEIENAQLTPASDVMDVS